MSVIEVRDLHKRYGDVHAVCGVSLDIGDGEVFALLGPNAAGKSTTIEMMEGHREPTSGSISVLGMDPATAGRAFRDRIGIVLQSSGIQDELSVIEALDLFGSVYSNRADPDEVLALVGLSDERDRRVRHLSGGQQRRIDLALGIIGQPDVLFLDEPTTGFDPSARRKSWDLIAGLRALGTTIVLTTHYMDEAQYLADRVAVIVDGEIVAEGSPQELMENAGDTVVSFHLDPALSIDGLAIDNVQRDGGAARFRTTDPTADLHRLTGWAVERSIDLHDLGVARPSLEDVYLELAATDEDGAS